MTDDTPVDIDRRVWTLIYPNNGGFNGRQYWAVYRGVRYYDQTREKLFERLKPIVAAGEWREALGVVEWPSRKNTWEHWCAPATWYRKIRPGRGRNNS